MNKWTWKDWVDYYKKNVNENELQASKLNTEYFMFLLSIWKFIYFIYTFKRKYFIFFLRISSDLSFICWGTKLRTLKRKRLAHYFNLLQKRVVFGHRESMGSAGHVWEKELENHLRAGCKQTLLTMVTRPKQW